MVEAQDLAQATLIAIKTQPHSQPCIHHYLPSLRHTAMLVLCQSTISLSTLYPSFSPFNVISTCMPSTSPPNAFTPLLSLLFPQKKHFCIPNLGLQWAELASYTGKNESSCRLTIYFTKNVECKAIGF